ncbi:MAG: glycosyltransferase family 4 protein, partial [Caulobacteraceae bacterium]
VDGFNLSMPRGTGIKTYARNLIGAIADMGYEPQVLFGPAEAPSANNLLNEISLFDAPRPAAGRKRSRIDRLLRRWPPSLPTAIRVTATGDVLEGLGGERAAGAKVAWAAQDVFHRANREHGRSGGFTELGFEGEGEPFKLMHWTCPLPLKAKGAPNVYTIHDLIPLRLPWATLDNKRRFHGVCERICREADHVVTVSESTTRDLMRFFAVEQSRVTTAWQSISMPAATADQPEEELAAAVEAAFQVPWRGYFLFLGAIEPKKNLGRLIEAYLAAGSSHPLVVVGGKAWPDGKDGAPQSGDPFIDSSDQNGSFMRSDRIRRFDYLPRTSLIGLLRGARALLWPSLFEGFGLPVLEAMALGTPVLTSNAGALPEVAGEATLMVDPYDVQAITRGIRALDSDEALRAELARKGAIQAARFSPEAHRDCLAKVYRPLL